MRCLWKTVSPLQSKTGNQLSPWDDMGCVELSSSCCTGINIHILETAVSGNLCSLLKEVKPLVLYSVEHVIAMEPMKGKWASSRVDLGYTELFCIIEVHQCSSRFVTVFLGTLCCSIKKIEAPYLFDW